MAGESRRLIVVSNRGPVSHGRDEAGRRVVRRGGGGLVTALRGLVSRHGVTWIASAMTNEDRAVAAEAGRAGIEETGRDGCPYRLLLVAHDRAAFDLFYNVFANPTLWFAQHGLLDPVGALSFDPRLHEAWAEGYVRVNEGIAEAVLAELEDNPDAAVFFHDYHFYLAPRLVREQRPDALLSHFVHTPWPEPDSWRVLPEPVRRAIHDGLLANDVVGFHTSRWRRCFLASAAAIVGAESDADEGAITYNGRRVLVTAHPISVDCAEFEEVAASADVLAEERSLSRIESARTVLRVDRTDPTKNIVRGFRAFELYLERHPEAHGRVGMIALLDPSRQDIPEYVAYLDEVLTAVREVNERFVREGWTPIHLEIQDAFPRSVAAYKRYDVLLVNAIFDGLNLVAKEAPLVNERDGVLILSENAGAHEELAEWVLSVNPLDVGEQAEAIHAALEMAPAERRARAEAIRQHVRRHDIEEWLDAQLADLDRVAWSARR